MNTTAFVQKVHVKLQKAAFWSNVIDDVRGTKYGHVLHSDTECAVVDT